MIVRMKANSSTFNFSEADQILRMILKEENLILLEMIFRFDFYLHNSEKNFTHSVLDLNYAIIAIGESTTEQNLFNHELVLDRITEKTLSKIVIFYINSAKNNQLDASFFPKIQRSSYYYIPLYYSANTYQILYHENL